MKIIFLVIDYMPHQLVSINAVIKNHQAEVHAFSYKNPHTIPQNIESLHTYELKDFTQKDFIKKIHEINPEIIMVAGWFVQKYVRAAKKIRKRLQIPIVTYSDTQWRSTWRQIANCLVSPFHLKKAFTHIWVAGLYQYEYARKLGFEKKQIIYNSLSCDIELFKQVSIESKKKNYPKNLIYFGRFVPVKGLEYLTDAWEQIADKKGWILTLIGDGSLKEKFKDKNGIILKDSMSQTELFQELNLAGCFILPSIFEPWALVIHEAAAAGLPIIATEVCGAVPHFLIDKFNGYKVKPANVESIKQAMEKIISMNEKQLIQFSYNSRQLAQSITPELGAANLMSLLNKR